ncbi:MAG TPA: hypothetical protein ENJ19_08430 [Gammaproteobacteria bacterium]|nr:hypothetical protein [Gammaproteobacteria bacterium]
MGWKFDNPLYSLADEEENKRNLALWEEEKYGGLWEGNNRLPYPLTYLIGLVILTAFLITMPIWGQRPTVALYAPMVDLMDSPEVQRMKSPEEKMAYLTQRAMEVMEASDDSRLPGLLERHPIGWYDLQLIADQVREIQSAGGPHGLDEYNIVGDQVQLSNYEGNVRPDGVRERKQPWWDRGFTIDVFYVSYFCLAMVLVCKRLPHFSQKPDMSKATT